MVRPTTFLTLALLAASAPALAQQPQGMRTMAMMQGPVVSLSVTESVEAAPDMAIINTGVETRALGAKDAMAENARKTEALIAALRKAGVDRKDIQTGRINLNPQYDYSERTAGEGPRFIGYVANNNLTVKLRKLDKAGETVDAMVEAGATNINGPTFGIDDTSPLEAQARDKAVKTAAQRAAAYARAAGYSSARLLGISETGEVAIPIEAQMDRAPQFSAKSASVTTPVEIGQLSTSVTLNFSYMLER